MSTQRTYFRPPRQYANATQTKLGRYAAETLGNGRRMDAAYLLPDGVQLNDWLAVSIVDVYNNVSQLYGTLTEFCVPTNETCATMNAGAKFEYLWADHDRVKKPIHCSAFEYANYLFDWIDDQMRNRKVFPTEPTDHYPRNFKHIIKTMCKKLFRIYAHMYKRHHDHLQMLEIYRHMNSSFKGFLYFCETFDLIDARETVPLRQHIQSNLGRGYKQPRKRRVEYSTTHSPAPPSSPLSCNSVATPMTPQSMIYHEKEEEISMSISQSPSPHLEIINEPNEHDFSHSHSSANAHSCPARRPAIQRKLSDPRSDRPFASSSSSHNGSSPTKSLSDLSASMSATLPLVSPSTLPRSQQQPSQTSDEIKARFARLKRRFLEDEPKEEPSRMKDKKDHKTRSLSSSPVRGDHENTVSEPTSPQLSPQPTVIETTFHVQREREREQVPEQEPVQLEEPIRRRFSPLPQCEEEGEDSEESDGESERLQRENDSLRLMNRDFERKLSSAISESDSLRAQLMAAKEEIRVLKREQFNANANVSARRRMSNHINRDRDRDRDRERESGSNSSPSPVPFSVISPSPDPNPIPHAHPSTPNSWSIVQRKKKNNIPPPPPMPFRGSNNSNNNSSRTKSKRVHPKTPTPTVQRDHGSGHSSRPSGLSRQMADMSASQSARILPGASLSHSHSVGLIHQNSHGVNNVRPHPRANGARISRSRAASNPKSFIIRRKNLNLEGKPVPKRALPKLPLPS